MDRNRKTAHKNRPWKLALLICAFLVIVPMQGIAIPAVSNVVFTQKSNGAGSTRLRVNYDLSAPLGTATVTLRYSTDGGVTFPGNATTITGDVGPGIPNGTNKTVNWALATDLPNQTFNNFAVRVEAEDNASNLAITNQGFETNAQPTATLTLSTPAGWTIYNPAVINGSSNTVGTLNPNGSTHYTSVPQGSNVGLVFLSGPNGEAGLEQTLGSTLQANTLYTLQVEVGNITSGTANFGFFNLDGFPGYRIEMRAGGIVLASDNNTLNTIPEGGWQTSTIRAAIGNSHPQLGTTLSIRLVNLDIAGTPSAPALEVNFDDVRLRATGYQNSAAQTVETVPPQISSLVATSSRTVQITFSESMAAPGPATPGNYTISGAGAGTLTAAPDSVTGGPATYTLAWSSGTQLNGQPFTVTVSGTVQDAQGNPLPINGTTNTASALALPVRLSLLKIE